MEFTDGYGRSIDTPASMDGKLARQPLSLREALVPSQTFPHITVVRDWALLAHIGRLRYTQYVEAQQKLYQSAVLQPNCLLEHADFTGVNICGLQEGQLTAAMRINVLMDSTVPASAVLLPVAGELGIERDRTLICTRLVRAIEHSGSHAADLIRFVRQQTVTAGYRYCLMQTAPRLVRYFTRFEFTATDVWTDDQAAGRLNVMLLDTRMQATQHRKNFDVAA
ncbi:hypothetical protein [Belnapia sp. F-4-1]|uniref:hypothetical protein n=1 Tax=Belnapia sp. F-4-1 TaxID=1545443 RepID=UPI001185AC06|nr:hypothetical protein [Belnapia sp. F-4-1]